MVFAFFLHIIYYSFYSISVIHAIISIGFKVINFKFTNLKKKHT
jgi:hypothetical protein